MASNTLPPTICTRAIAISLPVNPSPVGVPACCAASAWASKMRGVIHVRLLEEPSPQNSLQKKTMRLGHGLQSIPSITRPRQVAMDSRTLRLLSRQREERVSANPGLYAGIAL